jgi:hypothetical protein
MVPVSPETFTRLFENRNANSSRFILPHKLTTPEDPFSMASAILQSLLFPVSRMAIEEKSHE